MPSIVLIDGFTDASWTLERHRGTATLTVQPFRRLTREEVDDVTVEGAGLLDYLAPGAQHDVRLLPPRP